MKVFATFSLALIGLALVVPSQVRAGDSASANAMLTLTSSNEDELATASATSGVGYANAMAQPGFMSNGIETIAVTGSYVNETLSGFSDKLTITDPGLTGSAGTLEFHFLVAGTETFAGSLSSITAMADFTAPTITDDLTYTDNSSGVTSGSDFLGVPQTVVVPFTFGTPFTISLDLDVLASANGAASVTGTFNTTAGTDNVESAVQVVPVADYSARSASGENYFNNVQPLFIPEPGAAGLIATAALAAVPFLARRKRR